MEKYNFTLLISETLLSEKQLKKTIQEGENPSTVETCLVREFQWALWERFSLTHNCDPV